MPNDQSPAPDWTRWSLAQGWTRLVRSPAGVDYQLSLLRPRTPAPPQGYPLVCLLDGEALFAGAADLALRLSRRPAATGVGPVAILAIGRAGENAYDPAAREADYGSPDSEITAVLEAQTAALSADLPLDPKRRGLFGHSLAGYFALDQLAGQPGAFTHYAAISPSIWFGAQTLISRLEVTELGEARLLLAVGGREQPEGQGAEQLRRAGRRMIDNVRDLAALLAPRLGETDLRLAILADEDHASVVPPAMTRFLRLICED